MKKYLRIILISLLCFLIAIVIITPYILYFLKFKGISIFVHDLFPGDEEKWAQFGDFIGGTLNTILTFILLIMTLISLYSSIKLSKKVHKESLAFQEKVHQESLNFQNKVHEESQNLQKLSLKPFCRLSYKLELKTFELWIHNAGQGPLVINEISYLLNRESITLNKLFSDCLRGTDLYKFVHFSVKESTVVPANGKEFLVKILTENEQELARIINLVDTSLENLYITIIYTDTFNSPEINYTTHNFSTGNLLK